VLVIEDSHKKQLTVSRDGHGWFEKLLNFGAWIARLLHLPVANLNPDAIRQQAARLAGSHDIGDSACLERMDKVLSEVRDNDATSLSYLYFNSLTKRALVSRAKQQSYCKAHPEIRDIPIQRPVFVLGFPRTGTTILQNLLAQEPGRRTLKFWELTRPVPTHEDFNTDRRRRIRAARADLSIVYRCAPEMAQMHAVSATSSEECWPLFSMAFSTLNMDISTGLRRYGDWLLEQDMTWCYREYRQSLQMLLHRDPADQLILKCPEHLWFLDALLEVFPDACIVWTHREPTSCIASYCSMVSLNLRTVFGGYDGLELGGHITKRFHQGVSRALAVRERVGEQQFFDADFRQLVADPKGMVERISAHFGLSTSAQGRAAMTSYLETERKDAIGKHRYDPERYGLNSTEISSIFTDYINRFDLV
tara:strand:- start:661 stop:1920 length:1260 start_codon:yes stop_codon:yes gene_type:complete